MICKDRFTFCHSPDGNEPVVGDGVIPGAVVGDAVGVAVRLAVGPAVALAVALPPGCVGAFVDVAEGVPAVAGVSSVGDGPVVGPDGRVGLAVGVAVAVGGREGGVGDRSAEVRALAGGGPLRFWAPPN